ncbi:MAG: arginase family protein [Chloroflexi bacterium]|nr:arginase family protein [Chloroflexota bacterium]
MINQLLLTPSFLDQPLPEFLSLARADSLIIQPALPDADIQSRMSVIHKELMTAVATAVTQGRRPVSFAGDCCSTLAVAAGLQRRGLAPTLLWLDAHGDFNTWETSPGGFLGGMPLAMLVGRGEQRMSEAVGLQPWPETKVILSDARDLDPGEREAVAGSNILHLPHITQIPGHLPAGPLWVHFDVDVINPLDAPAMKYRAPGGPRAAALQALFTRLAASGNIVAVSVSAWDPALDHDGRTAEVCLGLFDTLVGSLFCEHAPTKE